MIELLQVNRNDGNWEIASSALKYVKKYVEVEAGHNKKYSCVKYGGSPPIDFSRDALLDELQNQRKGLVVKNESSGVKRERPSRASGSGSGTNQGPVIKEESGSDSGPETKPEIKKPKTEYDEEGSGAEISPKEGTGETLSEEERKAKSLDLLTAATPSGKHKMQSYRKSLKEHQGVTPRKSRTILALEEAVALKLLDESKVEDYRKELKAIVNIVNNEDAAQADTRMYGRAICRHLYYALSTARQKKQSSAIE
ncbi:hypothetical protein H0H93_016110, partial [Arthromyces matolae]